MHNLAQLTTEGINPATVDIDMRSTAEIVALINAEDRSVAEAVQRELSSIAAAVDLIAARLARGGRLIYVGAGTSGRLAAIDAAECGPTYSAGPDQVTAILAGGERAMLHASEGAEDDAATGAAEIAALGVGPDDAVVGVAASGRTPFVLGALEEARRRGAATVGVVNNAATPIEAAVDVGIAVVTGPEVVSGSTRMKAGTAQKMVLNMLTTATFIKLGKVYGNLMVDVVAGNAKLRDRARRILTRATGADDARAGAALAAADGNVKVALVSLLADVDAAEAARRLAAANGYVRRAVQPPA